jgi:hypothetical protein
MKSFQQFQEDLSKNTIPLGRKEQENLNKAKRGQIGPGSKPVPNTTFRLEPANIPMK